MIQRPKNAARTGIRVQLLGGLVYPKVTEDAWEWSLEGAIVGKYTNDGDCCIKYTIEDGGRDNDPSNCPFETPEVEGEANHEQEERELKEKGWEFDDYPEVPSLKTIQLSLSILTSLGDRTSLMQSVPIKPLLSNHGEERCK